MLDSPRDGLQLKVSTITTLTNTGTIKGNAGIHIWGSTIENLTNKGTIESKGTNTSVDQLVWNGGITATNLDGTQPSIKTLLNEGVIKAKNNGIFYETGAKIGTVINKGTIEAEQYGIYITKSYIQTNESKIGKIILEEGSIINAKKNAIYLNVASGKKTELGGIEVKKGSTIKSESGAAIAVAPNNHITGDINIAGKIEAKTNISNAGNISANISTSSDFPLVIENKGNANIAGNISSSGSGGLNLSNSGSGKIGGNIIASGSGQVSITNEGNGNIAGSISANDSVALSITNSGDAKINKGITLSGNAQLSISNTGSIGKNDKGENITNNSSGGVTIKDWVIANTGGKLDTLIPLVQ